MFLKRKKIEDEQNPKEDKFEQNQEDVEISFDNILSDFDEVPNKTKAKIKSNAETKSSTGTKSNAVIDVTVDKKEAERQIEEAKLEYKAVTEYLSDIQKIDSMKEEERKELEEVAKHIITLTRERSKFQTSDALLSDIQFKNISRYEDTIMREIKNMRENEDYQRKVKQDLRKLAAEKESLKYEKSELQRGQDMLKKLAVFAGSLIVLMDVIFLFLSTSQEIRIEIPFILSILMGAVTAIYVFWESRKNKEGILMNAKKRNRLITVTNKVKVKYVNTQNAIDYACEKFMVNNSMELNAVHDKYVMAKQEAQKYKSNTGMLNYYNEELVKQLDAYHLKDSEVWIYQAAALIDEREMVEIRHRLNVRRQKLRDRIDMNYKVLNQDAPKEDLD